jgi:hypothetical protein
MNPLLDILSGVGTVFDTPGSVVRGLLAGQPGRALGGIFDPEQRVFGRELLEQWGAIDPNQEGFDSGDLAGFGVDVAVDPLAFLGAFKGAKAAGGAAKRAILGPDAPLIEGLGAVGRAPGPPMPDLPYGPHPRQAELDALKYEGVQPVGTGLDMNAMEGWDDANRYHQVDTPQGFRTPEDEIIDLYDPALEPGPAFGSHPGNVPPSAIERLLLGGSEPAPQIEELLGGAMPPPMRPTPGVFQKAQWDPTTVDVPWAPGGERLAPDVPDITTRPASTPAIPPEQSSWYQRLFGGFHAEEEGSVPLGFLMGGAEGVPQVERKLAPTFYSRLEEAAKLLPENLKTQSVLNKLKSAPEGISMDEVRWRGLEDFLAKQGPVTPRSAILEHLGQNPIDVNVIRKGGGPSVNWTQEVATADNPYHDATGHVQVRNVESPEGELGYQVFVNDQPSGQFYNAGERAYAFREAEDLGMPSPHPTYSIEGSPYFVRFNPADNQWHVQRALEDESFGHFENLHHAQAYAESLARNTTPAAAHAWSGGFEGSPDPVKWSDYQTLPKDPSYMETLLTLNKKPWQAEAGANDLTKSLGLQGDDVANYYAPHWDEPNILAHMRHKERYLDPPEGVLGVPGPKALHIDEVQSDWHQAGKESGYQTPEVLARRAELQDLANEKYNELDPLLNPEEGQKIDYSLVDPVRAAAREFQAQADAISSGVPDAPFKDTWHELAMKQMLREAAEGGYDKITWNAGETIQPIVGGGLAGQQQFYNKQLPAFMQKVGKKYGVKVEPGNFPFEKDLDPNYAMSENLSPFSRGEAINRALQSGDMEAWWKARAVERGMPPDAAFHPVGDYTRSSWIEETWDDAITDLLDAKRKGLGDIELTALAEQKYGKLGEGFVNSLLASASMPTTETMPQKFFGMDIPPKMKEDILYKGQPLMNLAPYMAGAGGSALLAALLQGGDVSA